MFVRRLALFFLFLTICLKAFPAVFTVTSNADSGPGTLRDAILQAAANGTATQDIIQFNLPDLSVAGRTIALQSQLPDLTSNLIIDGTTQPGAKFGVSDAKVKITNKFVYKTNLNMFYSVGGDQIELYGLWLYGDMTGWGGSAFHFRNFGTIRIGAPSKGNLVEMGNIGIDTGKVCYFQSNICGFDITGEVPRGGDMTIVGCENVTIGGSKALGNTFGGTVNVVCTAKSTFEISYNNMGVNVTGTNAPYGFNIMTTRLNIEGSDNGVSDYIPASGVIKNNIIADVYASILLRIYGLSGKVTVQGNAFNTDFTGTLNFSNRQGGTSFAIACAGNKDILIGGDDPSEKNLIAYSADGIEYGNDGKYTITKNSIFCVGENSFIGFTGLDKLPQVKINSVTSNGASGTATPGSNVELFHADCSCYIPNPRDYFTTVKADPNGNWAYNGPLGGYTMASATLDSLTSLFAGLNIDDSKVIITNYTCNSTGSITGIVTQYSSGFQWFNDKNQLVGTDLDLKNVPPGTYMLKINSGTTCELTKVYQILDNSLVVNTSNMKIKPATCGFSNGYIWGITVNQPAILTWQGGGLSGTVDGTEVSNIPAGNYTFTFTTKDGSCSQTISPIVVPSASGPNIDQSHANITFTACGESTGSITNIQVTGTGTLQYSWLNDQQQQVATTKDLTNQPGGIYTLQVTDDSQCGPIFSTAIQIPETNGISLDESKVQTTIAGCGMNNGTITGMQVTGTAQYKWVDANNNIVATTIDFKNAAPGDYTFTAYNNSGCSKTSKTYHIGLQAVTQYPSYSVNSTPACSGQSNGSINISSDAVVASLRWVNSQGQNIGSSQLLNNVPKGTYQLYFTDANGCETLYNTYTVTELQPLSVASQGQVMSDQCGLKTGAINNIAVIGGQSPYTYTWTDAAGNQIGTGNSLSNLAAGDYHLNIADSRCGSLTVNYTITSQSEYVAAPSVSDVQLCSSGDAFISVNNPSSTFTYRLYDDQSNAQPLDEENSGRFKVTISNNRSYFISQLSGSCESSRSEIKVTVGVSAVGIPNTFTPNGDGINDYWSLKGMENNPNSLVQVFTRYGQKVFESKGYSHPFDGTYGGKELPTGVYYYIINLGTNCNILSGDVTIIR